jgi:hypothetical protein
MAARKHHYHHMPECVAPVVVLLTSIIGALVTGMREALGKEAQYEPKTVLIEKEIGVQPSALSPSKIQFKLFAENSSLQQNQHSARNF